MRTIFIGDLHGCAEEFQRLLDVLNYQADSDRLFLVGDAFTKGPDPVGVWTLIQATGARMVMGNHDAKLLDMLKPHHDGSSIKILSSTKQQTLDEVLPISKAIIPWLEALPLWIEEDPFLLVHAGINPEKGVEGTSRDEFLAIRTWPPTGNLYGARWHDAYLPENKLIIFGHDAPGGLVYKRRKDRSPYAIGLDTGCVYGRKLSGYILEEDRIVQVKKR